MKLTIFTKTKIKNKIMKTIKLALTGFLALLFCASIYSVILKAREDPRSKLVESMLFIRGEIYPILDRKFDKDVPIAELDQAIKDLESIEIDIMTAIEELEDEKYLIEQVVNFNANNSHKAKKERLSYEQQMEGEEEQIDNFMDEYQNTHVTN